MDEQKLESLFKLLGSKMKMLFDNKQLEDKELNESINSNLIDIEEAIKKAKESIDSKTNSDMIKAIKELESALNSKDLQVNVEAPIVNVPEPQVKVVPETKEAIKAYETFEKALYLMLKQNAENSVLILNSQPNQAVPVKLTDKDGKRFYNAVFQAMTSAGGGFNQKDPFVEITKGEVPGTEWAKIVGRSESLTIDQLETIWDQGGQYVYLSQDTQLFASSDDPADTDVQIKITGLYEDLTPFELYTNLNGQTQEPFIELSGGSSLSFRVFEARVVGNTYPQGDVYIAPSTPVTGGIPNDPTQIKAKIQNGFQRSQNGIYTVPARKIAIPVMAQYSVRKNDDVNYYPLVREPNGVFIVENEIPVYQNSHPFKINGIKYTEGTDIEIRGLASNDQTKANVIIDLIILQN